MEKRLLVSCKHKVEKYHLTNEAVTAKQDRFDGRWFVSIPGFGCSKSYRSPEAAVYGMLQEHACHSIVVRSAQ